MKNKEPSDQDLNVSDAGRMLAAAILLKEITVIDPTYHEMAWALVSAAKKILEHGARAARF